MPTKIKPISFDKNNWDLYDHLKRQDNASKYVCRLIRDDINNNKLEVKVKAIIDEYLNNQNKDNSDENNTLLQIKDMLK